MTTPHVPLTDAQKALPSGMLLPSGEAGFFDSSQAYDQNGSGINVSFPNPTFTDGYWDDSGIFRTYGPDTALVVAERSGFLAYDGLSGIFSNGPASQLSGINDFTLFNPYIHHYSKNTPTKINTSEAVAIPFVSDYTVSVVYDVYF